MRDGKHELTAHRAAKTTRDGIGALRAPPTREAWSGILACASVALINPVQPVAAGTRL